MILIGRGMDGLLDKVDQRRRVDQRIRAAQAKKAIETGEPTVENALFSYIGDGKNRVVGARIANQECARSTVTQ